MPIATLIRHGNDPPALLIWCAIGLAAGIVLFFYGFRLLQRRRLILDTPFSKIRSAAMGMVEISGLAVGPYTMIAPITGRPCYYHRTLVWEYKQHGKNKEWVKVAGECMHVPFFVDDNTGRVMVDPRGADLDLHRDFQEEFCDSFFTIKDPAPANVHAFLARHGVVTSNKIKVEEFCIKPKNSLFILGTLADNQGLKLTPQPIQDEAPISSYSPQGFSLSIGSFSLSVKGGHHEFQTGSPMVRGFIQNEVKDWQSSAGSSMSTPRKPLDGNQQKVVADALLKAGISNPAAWAAAGIAPSGAAVTTAPVISTPDGNTADFDPDPAVVLRKGQNDKTFLISWRSQREVARSLGWKCVLMVWGGAALALISVYFFLAVTAIF